MSFWEHLGIEHKEVGKITSEFTLLTISWGLTLAEVLIMNLYDTFNHEPMIHFYLVSDISFHYHTHIYTYI